MATQAKNAEPQSALDSSRLARPGSTRASATTSLLVPPSRRILTAFNFYLRWYIGRHFRALRLAHGDRFPATTGPLIVYANHASWWDPLAFIVLSRHFQATADHYAPMEAAALAHYGLFRKLGLFPVEPGTPRGAVQFLRTAQQITSTPNSILWVTPEGRFTDMRTRPAVFRPGLAALVARLGNCTLMPLAFEYTFWDERLPELLVSCGRTITVTDGALHTTAEWSNQLASALSDAQDELATQAKQRDPASFTTLLAGGAGVGSFYDSWKRLVAALSGRPYQGTHGSIRRL